LEVAYGHGQMIDVINGAKGSDAPNAYMTLGSIRPARDWL